MQRETVTIVSGLPRSGTSMMMKMLEAGGMRPLTDNIRAADDDNPKGYYEFERVKDLEKDTVWLEDARGRVVKVISMLLRHLPASYNYKVVFMRRKMEEVLASQRKMLIRRGEAPDKISDEKMGAMFEKHLAKLEDWLAGQPNIEVLYIHYTDALGNPTQCAERINDFLGATLDVEKMASVVDEALYRHRR